MKKTARRASQKAQAKLDKRAGFNSNKSAVAASRNGKVTLHETKIDLPAKTRMRVIELLNQSLADTFDLQSQVKQAHWNVKGIHFYQLHLLFDELAGELEDFVDLIAERVTTLGGTALGTARMAARATRLPEYPVDVLEGIDHVEQLVKRYAMHGEYVRHAIDETNDLGDADTADIYTEISRDIDKRLWFLEAHLQGQKPRSR